MNNFFQEIADAIGRKLGEKSADFIADKIIEAHNDAAAQPDFKLVTMLSETLAFENVKEHKQAKEDVLPFIKDPSKLDLWSADFLSILHRGYRNSRRNICKYY